MAKIPKLPKGQSAWEEEDRTPLGVRKGAVTAPEAASRGVYDLATLSPARARYWLAMDGWTAVEAAQLLCALDPGAIFLLEARPGGREWVNSLDWPLHYDDLLLMVARAGDMGALVFPAEPVAVLAWADGKNVRMPAEFRARLDESDATHQAPIEGSQGTAPTDAKAATPSTVHRALGMKSNILTPVILDAIAACGDERQVDRVWAQLEAFAAAKKPPFIGAAEGDLKFSDGGVVKAFSRKNLADRLRRLR